jgi:hypothetical protein
MKKLTYKSEDLLQNVFETNMSGGFGIRYGCCSGNDVAKYDVVCSGEWMERVKKRGQ